MIIVRSVQYHLSEKRLQEEEKEEEEEVEEERVLRSGHCGKPTGETVQSELLADSVKGREKKERKKSGVSLPQPLSWLKLWPRGTDRDDSFLSFLFFKLATTRGTN